MSPTTDDVSGPEFRDAGHGFDPLGMSKRGADAGVAFAMPMYKYWFRVQSQGIENIPRTGRCIVAGNHSGTLPFDAVMVYVDLSVKTRPRRYPRFVGDQFIPNLPWVSTFFTRAGMVAGSRGNFKYLLENEALLVVFPEGTPGIGKPFAKRYQLQDWRVGHCELAIRHRAPIVPTALIGAEEQMPQLARIPISLFGAPWLPISATLFPLPVRYHIHYGAPVHLADRYAPDDADNPTAVAEAAALVKGRVQSLIDHGLAERKGVFT